MTCAPRAVSMMTRGHTATVPKIDRSSRFARLPAAQAGHTRVQAVVLGGEALVDRRRHGHSAFNWALMWSRWGRSQARTPCRSRMSAAAPQPTDETKTETDSTNASHGRSWYPAFLLVSAAEDAGFEPARAVTPNTISNSPWPGTATYKRSLRCRSRGEWEQRGEFERC